MAKMTRDNLKSLVKECLFEILLEASGDEGDKLVESKRKRKPSAKRTSSRRPALDMTVIGKKSSKPPAQKKIDVSGITSDPVMAAIFQDTATTTLVEQAAAERGKSAGGAADAAAHIVSQNDPSDLFGESSKNWAALAFDD